MMDSNSGSLMSLSQQAMSIWGKSDRGEGVSWLPLFVHMADSAGVAQKLWDEWLPRACGDDPSISSAMRQRMRCSPYMRG
jgi:hypothetical protein